MHYQVSLASKRFVIFGLFFFFFGFLFSQQRIAIVDELNVESQPLNSTTYVWLRIGDSALSNSLLVPVIIVKGASEGPTMGIISGIHGNELNGIEVIRRVLEQIDPSVLKGTIVAVPGLNVEGMNLHQREFSNGVDLNRIFPGKQKGDESGQFVWNIDQKILPIIDYLVDMHTASFGRINSLYVRADLSDPVMRKMALLQNPDIVLNSAGEASTANSSGAITMRARAMNMGIPSITIEYGNPQVYQPEMIDRGVPAILALLGELDFIPKQEYTMIRPVVCKKSYWVYTDQGGLLDVQVELTQKVRKNQLIAILRDPFGNELKRYDSPEDGVVIGLSSNPVGGNGARIIHLGIIDESLIPANDK